MHSYIYLHCVDAILIGRNSATRRVWPPVARTVHTPNVLIQNSFNYPSSSRPFIRVLFFCLCSVFVLLFLRRVDPRIHFIYMSPLLYVGSVQIHPMQSIGVQLNNHLYIFRASMLLAEHTPYNNYTKTGTKFYVSFTSDLYSQRETFGYDFHQIY